MIIIAITNIIIIGSEVKRSSTYQQQVLRHNHRLSKANIESKPEVS